MPTPEPNKHFWPSSPCKAGWFLVENFRVWYDTGIEAGTEWPEYIAERLLGSRCVVAFISPNAMNSHNCRREINFAIAKQKDFLVVYLEEMELTPGMQMQLDVLQAMFRCRSKDDESFLNALADARLLQSCRDGGCAAPADSGLSEDLKALMERVRSDIAASSAPDTPADPEMSDEVKSLLEKARNGAAGSQLDLGWHYEMGKGVAKDTAEAAKWYRRAADQGNARAQCNLGSLYEKGSGVAKDEEEAVKWYRKSADQGYTRAQQNLSLCYKNGIGVRKSWLESEKWRKLAEK